MNFFFKYKNGHWFVKQYNYNKLDNFQHNDYNHE